LKNNKVMGPNPAAMLDYKELPIGATQIGPDSNAMKTGTWRFIRPVLMQYTPPCNEACPAGIDIRKFIGLVKEGNLKEAFEVYTIENPFPAICGRVCFHPCEVACNRSYYDEAVSINGLENYIGDNAPWKFTTADNNGKEIAIIGSGPAGLSCAYFLRRLGYLVKILEKEPEAGGLLRYGIPEYRLPKKILDKELHKLSSLGIDIETNKEAKLSDELKPYAATFIATGAQASAGLDIPGAEADGVISGLDFLKQVVTNKLDTFEKRVVIIGGGNTAIDTARTVLRLKGKPTIFYRRTQDEIPAIKDELSDCEKEGVEFQYLTAPVQIISKRNKVTGVEFIRNKLGQPDQSNRPTPVPIKGSSFKVNADAVVLAIGEGVALEQFPKELQIERQLIKINKFGQSNLEKVFAGGDIVHYQRTVVDAIRSGKTAAIGIDCYLKRKNEKEILNIFNSIATNGQGALSFQKYMSGDFSSFGSNAQIVKYDALNDFYLKHQERIERSELPVSTRILGFKEVRKGYSEKIAKREVERCFSCGLCNSCGNCFVFCPDSSVQFKEIKGQMMEFNYDYCKGCGICMEECPRGAIRMEQEA
jgi:2-oxoacid:acceptor oxidoreductase delta subunit (pyruvate/2-ketoisovalerate family)